MAKYGKTLAEVLVQINGTSQTKKVLEALTQTSKELGDKIKVARAELEKLAESGGGPAYDAKKKELAAMVKEQTQLNRAVNETKKFSQSVGDILNNISNNNVSVLNRTKRTLEALLNSITPNTKKAQNQIEQLQKAIQRVTDEIARRKGQLVDLDKVMANLGKATPKQLDAVEKRLQTLLESVTKNSNAWRKYDKQMRLLQEERSKRTTAQAQDIMGGNYTKTIEGTKLAIEFLKKYQQTLNATDTDTIDAVTKSINKMNEELETAVREKAAKVMGSPIGFSPEEINEAIKYTEKLQAATPDGKEWTEYAKQIAEAKKVRDSFADSAKMEIMADQFSRLTQLSDAALSEQKKYWEDVFKNAEKGTNEYDLAEAKLKKIVDLQNARMKSQSKETLTTNLGNAGTADIKQSVEWLTKYQSTLEPLSREWRDINALIEAGNNRLKQLSDDVKMEAMADQFSRLTQLSDAALSEQKKYWEDVFKNAEKGTNEYDLAEAKLKKIVDLQNARMKSQSKETLTTNLGNAGTADIKQSVEWLTKYQSTLEPLSREWRDINALIEAGNNRLKQLSDDVKMEAMADQFSRLTQLSDAALAGQKKYWEDVFRNAEKGTANYITAEGKLKQIKNLEQGRLRTEATTTINNAITGNFNKTNEETREAIKLIEEYKKQLATGNVDAIKEADRAITELNHKLDQAKKSSALDILGDMDNHSTEQIKQAVDWLTKYRSTLATSTQEWKDLGVEIEKANEYMRSAEGADKMAVMEQKLNSIGTVSTSALAELKKYWQEVVDGTDKSNANLAQYEDNLRRVIEEEKARKAVSADAVMTNLDGSSVVQIREAIKATEELRESVKRSDPQWAQYNSQIENAKNYLEKFEIEAKKTAALDVAANLDIASTGEMKQTIDFLTKYRDTLSTIDPEYDSITQALEATTEALKKFNDSAKMDAMNKQMQNLNNLSKAALAEQKKYWQGVYDSAEKTSQAYKDAESNLMKLDLLERSRTSADATQNITEALSGNWDKTIKETEEAIKLIQEYKNQLRTQSDTVLIDQANEAIDALNRNLGKAKEALMDVNEAERIASEVNIGDFHGTSQDIADAKKSLEEFRKTLLLIDDKDRIEKIDEHLTALSVSAEQGGKNLKKLDEILDDLDSASMEDLQGAAKRLQEELKKAERNTDEYAKTSLKLQRVNKELEKVKKEWEGQESLFIRMTKRLSVYMAAYGSLSAVISYVKDLGKANLQLSDSIADVAKTTGLNAKELAKLGEDIRAIDTRTAQEQLYELAAAAGQLGIKSEAEVAGFVRAANMITVSLNELGTEATTQLMKIATLTGESQDGTEKALLSIGSAINELTASSAAAAGPIVDLMNRMGGIAAQSKITSAQMAAIGATADALGQSVEITGTSMNKFLATLMSNTDQIAYALNMDAKALRSFINEGKTMDAVIAIFERMNDMGGLGKLAPVMGDLGSEGARMTQVLAAMAEKVDFLKGQLDISTEAYEKATSIQTEYNVKNENAIAILQRMGNALKETFVNNVFVDALTALLRIVYKFFTMLGEGSALAYTLTASIAGLTAALLANRLAWVQNLQAVTKLYPHLVRMAIWQSLTSAVKSFTLALLGAPKAVATFIASMFKLNTWANLLTKGIAGVKVALQGLFTLLKGNWITVLVGAFVALGSAIYKATTYVSQAAKATAKYNRELQEETDKVDTLFNSLKRLNSTEADRARTINAINSQYGQYLGFMLDEKDSAEKLAAAHQLINAELRKRMALNLRTALEGTANNDYAEQLEKSSSGIGKAVENLKVNIDGKDQKERSVTTSEVIRLVTKTINERVAKDTSVSKEQLLSEIKTAMSDAYRRTDVSNTGKQYTVEVGADLFEDIEDHIGDLIDSRIKFQKKVALAEDQANVELEQLTKDALEARKNFLKQTESDINEAKNQTANLEKELEAAKTAAAKYEKKDESKEAVTARQNYELKEKELRDHYEKMVDNANDYVEATQKLMEDHNESLTEDDKMRMNQEIKMYQDFARETAKLAPGMDPWNKGRDVKDWREFSEIVTNLDTSSAKALAAAFKKIKDEAALFPDDVQKVYELFQVQGVDEISLKKLGLKDATSVADMVWKWEKQIKDKLETKFHRNTELGFIFKDETGGKRQKDEFEAALASLEAYYNDREEIVRKNALLEEITQEELDKRLQSLEQEHLSARIELRKLMLSKENSFLTTFSHAAESEYMQGIDYNKLQTQLEKLGKSMSQGLEKKLTEDMVALQKIVWTHQEEISKILLENDPVQKVAVEYQKSFEKLDMLWSDDEQRTKDAAREKMATLLEFSSKRSQLSDKDMRKQLEESKQFSKVVKTMSAEEFQAFLILLDQYAEAATNAKRQATQKAVRSLEFGFDNSGMGMQVSARLQHIEDIKGQLNEMQSSGLTMDGSALKKQKELVEQRIALEQLKWNTMIETEKNGMNRMEVLQVLMLEKDKKTYQARLEVMKLIMDMDAKMFDESGSRIDQMQGWGAISEIKATERKRDLINAELALQQMRIDEMIRIEEEGQNRMEVIENLRMARKDALYKADRRLTELTMQEYQQRTQVANEWGTAIGNGLGEMIAGTEDAGKALVKNLATMAVQSIGQMAQMYVAKQLLLSQQNMAEAASAMTTATTAAAEATAVGAAKTAEATAIAMATPDSVLTYGASGAAKAAVISGLIAAAVAASIAIINSLFPGAGSKATSSNRKLSTGMLTYAEGNYPVLGNDGKVYDAKYEGAGMKTGIYGGGAHFGIFSEKQPEMIVDGKTTQKLILNYPYIYDAITTIAKNGRLVNAMPTFASGDYPAGMKQIAPIATMDVSTGSNEQMERMSAALEQTQAVNNQLLKLLQGGIAAHLDGLETYRTQKRNERFLKRRGID